MDAEILGLALVAFLLTYTLHSTILLACAWLGSRLLPRGAVLARERLWKLALLGGVASAAVQLLAGIEPPLGRWVLPSSEVAARDPSPAGELRPPAAPAPARAPARTAALEAYPEAHPAFARLVDGLAARFQPAWERLPWASREPRETEIDPPEAREIGAGFERALVGPLADDGAEAAPGEEDLEQDLAAAVSTARPPAGTGRAALSWSGYASIAWVALCSGALLALALACRRVRRRLRGCEEIRSGPMHARLRALLGQAGVPSALARRVRLWRAPELEAPVSLGWLRPSIYVPPRAERELSADEQDALLAHELAHLLRRDTPWLVLCGLIESVFFFQPLNRLARRELAQGFELLCDEWAARVTGDRVALASCLARVAGWITGARRPHLAAGMAGHRCRSLLGRRIETLLDERPAAVARHARWASGAALAAIAALCLIVPGVSAERSSSTAAPARGSPVGRFALVLEAPAAPDGGGAGPCEDGPCEPAPPPDLDEEPPAPSPGTFAAASAGDEPRSGPDAAALLLAELDQSIDALAADLEALKAEVAELGHAERLETVLIELELRAARLALRRERLQHILQASAAPRAAPALEPNALSSFMESLPGVTAQ